MSNTAYKVVRYLRNGSRTSAVIHTEGWQTTYTPEEWTPTSKTGYFVFETLEDAKDFKAFADTLEIWECEVEGPLPVPPLIFAPYLMDSKALFLYWQHPEKETSLLRAAPKGTQLYKRVKLTQQIQAAWETNPQTPDGYHNGIIPPRPQSRPR